MTSTGDRITAVLVRELISAEAEGLRVLALTTSSSLIAALAANKMGASLALAAGFGTLDAPCEPTLTLGDARLATGRSSVGPLSDTFAAVARGMAGVFVSPAQLDGRGATNLSYVGGSADAPLVALPGSRGLPDNNDSPSRVWYLFSSHNSRTLVDRVDFDSGPPPSPDRIRRMITPLGLFVLSRGWHAEALFPGVDPSVVHDKTGFAVDCGAAGVIADPTSEELSAMEAVDPLRMREIEFLPGAEAGPRVTEIARLERA